MRAVLALVVLGGSAATGAAGPATGWVEIRTPNFTVASNAGEGSARRTAIEFEQVRAAYAKLWPGTRLQRAKPTVVLALKDEGTLKRWVPGHYEAKGAMELVSMSVYGADRDFLLLRVDSRPSDPNVSPNYNLYRSYLRLLISGSFERRLPEWLANGFAQVFGNTEVRGAEIRVGQPVPWEFRQFNTRTRMPLQKVLDTRSDSPLLRREDERQVFDAQCYVLVHYFVFADRGAQSARLTRFQQLWQAGRTPDQAQAEALGDLQALEREVALYATRPILSYARFAAEAPADRSRAPLRALEAAEVAALQAAVHVAMGRPVEAQEAIRQARAADARSAASYDAEGLLADRDQDKARAAQAYAQALELGSVNAHSYYRSAQLAWKPSPDAETLALVRQRLEKAIALGESHAGARSYLADVLVDQKEGALALAHAERAVALEPDGTYHRVALGRALHALGRDDDARRVAQAGLELAEDEADRANAERLLAYLADAARYAREKAEQDAANACQDGVKEACERLLPEWERRCGDKQGRACAFLAWLHSGRAPLAQDDAKVAGYRERGCVAGDKTACVEHAWAQAHGVGLAKDEPKAVAALDALCGEGFLPACTRLAFVHLGRPAARDRARAKALFAQACEGGDSEACRSARQLR